MDFDDAFQNALIKYVDTLGRGGQARVCEKTGLRSTEISAICRRARTASEQNKHIISEALGFTYESFLRYGGWKDGEDHQYYENNKTHSIIPDGEMERVKMAQELKKIYSNFDRTSNYYFNIYKSGDDDFIASFELMMERISGGGKPKEKPGASAPGKSRGPASARRR
jgi:hypothetical protein